MRRGGDMFRYYECEKCGKKYFPRKIRCYCGSMSFKEVVVDKAIGSISTYTVILVPPKGFTPPIYIGIAEYDGMKILGRYVGDPERLKVGIKVELHNDDGTTTFSPIE
jgi:uncharacterized OB-fold protein